MRDRRASVAVEFALVLPVMLLLAGGLYGIGSLLRVYVAVNRLVMQYALSYADCSDTVAGTCLAELDQYGTAAAVSNIFPQLTPARLVLTMSQVSLVGSALSVVYAYPTGQALSAAQQSALYAVLASGQTGIVVTATYQYVIPPFALILAPITGSSVTISYTVAQAK